MSQLSATSFTPLCHSLPLSCAFSTPACSRLAAAGPPEPGALAAARGASVSGHNGASHPGFFPPLSVVGVFHPAPYSGGWRHSGAVMPSSGCSPHPPSPWFSRGRRVFRRGPMGLLPHTASLRASARAGVCPPQEAVSVAFSTAPSSAPGVVIPPTPALQPWSSLPGGRGAVVFHLPMLTPGAPGLVEG